MIDIEKQFSSGGEETFKNSRKKVPISTSNSQEDGFGNDENLADIYDFSKISEIKKRRKASVLGAVLEGPKGFVFRWVSESPENLRKYEEAGWEYVNHQTMGSKIKTTGIVEGSRIRHSGCVAMFLPLELMKMYTDEQNELVNASKMAALNRRVLGSSNSAEFSAVSSYKEEQMEYSFSDRE